MVDNAANGHGSALGHSQATNRMQSFLIDSLMNVVSGLGTNRDKQISSVYGFTPINEQQLVAAYRSDWIARKVVTIPAEDQTREWRSWQADKNDITKLESEEKRLGLQEKTRQGEELARLYGGAALIIGDGVGDPAKQLDVERVKAGGLKYVHVVTMMELKAGVLDTDLSSEWFGGPKTYELSLQGATPVSVHPSRVVRFLGVQMPDWRIRNDPWGDSVLQAMDQQIKNSSLTEQAIAALVHEAKIDVVKIPGLMANIGTAEYEATLTTRIQLASILKGLLSTYVLDSEEDWERNATSFAGLPEILKLYLLLACGASDIPATRMLGQSAMGLNATGEGDLINYYDMIASRQKTRLGPRLSVLDEVLIRSALGARPPELHYNWNSLWQMSAAQKADIAVKKAAAYKTDVDAGLIEGPILRDARINQLIEDGFYPGFEQIVDDFVPLEEQDLDEEDEDVDEQFGRSKAAANENNPEDEPGATGTEDSRPMTLYVRRDVLNADEILAWARSQGVDGLYEVDDLHVTVAYSKTPVDWIKMGEGGWFSADPKGELVIPEGGPRVIEKFGRPGDEVLVLCFASDSLRWRNRQMRDEGASWDWPDYQPHVSFARLAEGQTVDLESIEPYRGVIRLGPEIFEEIDEGRPA